MSIKIQVIAVACILSTTVGFSEEESSWVEHHQFIVQNASSPDDDDRVAAAERLVCFKPYDWPGYTPVEWCYTDLLKTFLSDSSRDVRIAGLSVLHGCSPFVPADEARMVTELVREELKQPDSGGVDAEHVYRVLALQSLQMENVVASADQALYFEKEYCVPIARVLSRMPLEDDRQARQMFYMVFRSMRVPVNKSGFVSRIRRLALGRRSEGLFNEAWYAIENECDDPITYRSLVNEFQVHEAELDAFSVKVEARVSELQRQGLPIDNDELIEWRNASAFINLLRSRIHAMRKDSQLPKRNRELQSEIEQLKSKASGEVE